MSYILDALRKSDQQRQRGAAPTLQSAQFIAVPAEPRARWIYAVLAAALATAAFAMGWTRPWRTEPPRAEAPHVALTAVADRAAIQSPTPDAMTIQSLPQPAKRKPASAASRVQRPASTASQPAPAAGAKREAPSASAASAQAATPAREKPSDAGKAAAPPDEKVLSLAELPGSLRQELPQMTVSVHSYSRVPKDRLVGINDRLLHEGDAVAPGLVLERITPDGMIFSYKGTRFHRGVL